jgi:hypothetical protein
VYTKDIAVVVAIQPIMLLVGGYYFALAGRRGDGNGAA